jgi:uncharacterized protein YcbX
MFAILGGIASIIATHSEQKDSSVVDITEELVTKITDLIIYPCRGVKGIHLTEANITPTGFELDREWTLLEREITQEENQKPGSRWVSIIKNQKVLDISCRFELKDGVKYLVFSCDKHQNDLWINTTKEYSGDAIEYYNFELHKIEGFSEGEDAARWFSDAIGRDVVLVRSQQKKKSSTHDYEFHYPLCALDERNSNHTHAAIHLISEKSLEYLNSKISEEVYKAEAIAFRPNIVIEGIEHDEEDDLREVEFAEQKVRMRMVKHCVR